MKTILDIDTELLAKEICLINHETFVKIKDRELAGQMYKRKATRETYAPNVSHMMVIFNQIIKMAQYSVINASHKWRVKILEKWINICDLLLNKYQNTQAASSLKTAFDSAIFHRQKTLFDKISNKTKNKLKSIRTIFKIDNSYQNLKDFHKNILNNMKSNKKVCGFVPFVGIYMNEIGWMEDKLMLTLRDNKDTKGSLRIRLQKWKQGYDNINKYISFNQYKYNFKSNKKLRVWLTNEINIAYAFSETQLWEMSSKLKN